MQPNAERTSRFHVASTRLTGVLSRYALAVAAVLLALIFVVLLPGTFATTGNLVTILSSQSVLLILALAVTIPLRAGEFDLSVAQVAVFCAAILGLLTTEHGVPLIPACIITLLVGMVIGAINGFFIVNLGINAFIITLGSMTILSGLTFGITGGNVIVNLPPALLTFGRQEVFGLPLAIYYGWALALFLAYIYERTPIGRYLLFVGGNRDAARLAGLPVTQIRFLAFVFSSLVSAFAGIVLASKLGAIDPTIGPSYLLPPYAAAFLGTTAVHIGRFNVGGTVIAIYMLIIGITGLLLMGSDPWVSDAFDGGALIVAVTFAGLAGRKAAD